MNKISNLSSKSNRTEQVETALKNLPKEPGVYKFFNADNEIIYIGKAKNLKNRVSSYFVKSSGHNKKTLRLISEIRHLEYTIVETELDALLLENNLIKANQPKYNILLKDGKTYPYICVTNEPFPRVFSTRNLDNRKNSYYGPYASVRTMNALLELFKKLYNIRTCSYHLSDENIEKKKFKVCLDYHIGNCLGPCEGLQTAESYDSDISQISNILKGKISVAKNYFKEKMEIAAENLEYEKAHILKTKYELVSHFQKKSIIINPKITDLEVYAIIADEKIAYINFMKVANGCIIQTESIEVKKMLDESKEEILAHVIFNFRSQNNTPAQKIISNVIPNIELGNVDIIIPKIGDLKKLVELSLKNIHHYKKVKDKAKINMQESKNKNYTLLQLKADLNLKTLPRHIECFDNSNIQGTNPVASMVCFKDGKPAKNDYRKFKIKTVVGPDDFKSMNEVVGRRYKRLLEEDQPLPDLIVIDGGKGQLSAACDALKDLGLYGKMPIIGIAKRLEEIYFPGDKFPLHINKKSRSLALIQKVRDEAHRFAITFHRNERSKYSIDTELQDIKGIGKNTIQKLLSEFKSVNNIKNAEFEKLESVIGNQKATVISNYFNKLKPDE